MPDTHCIPVSATDGDNVVTRSTRTPWYDGPTVLGYLENVDDRPLALGSELRFPVQYVIRPQTAAPAPGPPALRRWTGTTAATRARSSPDGSGSARRSWCCRAARTPWSRRIDTPDGPLEVAGAGQSVVLRLAQDVDVSRGDILAATDAPPAPVRDITATVCWLAERELTVGARVLVQHGTSVTKAIVKAVESTLDLDFEAGAVPGWVPTGTLRLNDIGRIRLALASPLPIDAYREHRTTGAFILVDEADGWTLGAGMAGTTPMPTVAPDPPNHRTTRKEPS